MSKSSIDVLNPLTLRNTRSFDYMSKEDKFYQPSTDTIYTSIHYNLKQICPRLLEHKYSYLKYHQEIYLFSNNDKVLKDLLKVPLYQDDNNTDFSKNLLLYSNYLAYNIFISYLRESYVVLKDMEQYYNSQMMTYLKKLNLLKEFPLQIIASYWTSISRTLTYLKEKVKNYQYYFSLYDIYYSDNEHNFKDTIPLVGINKDNSVSLTYFTLTSGTREFITGSYLDLVRVPSLCKVFLFFYDNGIKIQDVNIIWLTSGDTFKFHRFVSAKYKDIYDRKLVEYIRKKYEVNPRLIYTTNFNKCYTCSFWKECVHNNHFLNVKTTNIQVL